MSVDQIPGLSAEYAARFRFRCMISDRHHLTSAPQEQEQQKLNKSLIHNA
jgi:hypothetical protein